MGLGLDGISNGVADYVNGLFDKSPGGLPSAVGQALKSPPQIPGAVVPLIGVEIGRRACRRYADNAELFDQDTAANFEVVCRPYLDDIGYGEPPTVKLPFRGGQCCGVTYNYTYSFRNPNTGTIQDSQQSFTDRQLVGLFERSNQPAQPTKSGGPRFRRCSDGAIIDVPLGTTFESLDLEQSISNIVRADGLPDNCGNVPPVVTDPVPPPLPDPPGPQPFNPDPSIDIDLDVDVVIAPVIGPVIVFDIGVGPVTINPFGGGDDDGGGPGGGSPGPGDVGSPAAPSDTGEDGVASGCAPEGSVIAGVKVNILAPLPEVSEFDPLVRRGVCYVYFGVPGNLALDPSGVALRDGQFCIPPVDNLTCYEVRANFGYNLRVTPYYRALEQE